MPPCLEEDKYESKVGCRCSGPSQKASSRGETGSALGLKKSYGCSEGQDSIEGMWGCHETGRRLPAKTDGGGAPEQGGGHGGGEKGQAAIGVH